MTAADVGFSIDDARPRTRAGAISTSPSRTSRRPTPRRSCSTSSTHGHLRADIALFANGIIPKNFAGQKRAEFYKHPIGTGPFMWDKRSSGSRSASSETRSTGRKASRTSTVTWTYVSDQNTRELQLRGGQIEVDEFPPFSSIKKLQNTPA